MYLEISLTEELRNICHGAPLWPGDTISHGLANECVRRGWAERDRQGRFSPTQEGKKLELVRNVMES